MNQLGIRDGGTIVEVGGYVGEYVEQLRVRYPNSRFIVYEIMPHYCAAMRERFKQQPVIIKQAALSDHNGTTGITAAKEGSYTTSGNDAATLDVAHELKDGCTLLNMNCEGGEYAILERLCSTGGIRNIDAIQIDWHWTLPDWKQRRKSLRKKLSETHRLKWRWPYARELWEKKP